LLLQQHGVAAEQATASHRGSDPGDGTEVGQTMATATVALAAPTAPRVVPTPCEGSSAIDRDSATSGSAQQLKAPADERVHGHLRHVEAATELAALAVRPPGPPRGVRDGVATGKQPASCCIVTGGEPAAKRPKTSRDTETALVTMTSRTGGHLAMARVPIPAAVATSIALANDLQIHGFRGAVYTPRRGVPPQHHAVVGLSNHLPSFAALPSAWPLGGGLWVQHPGVYCDQNQLKLYNPGEGLPLPHLGYSQCP